jgi:aryl-alcohol dehydrogenase-like predicted oxidoreductase
VAHVEENIAAAGIDLPQADFDELNAIRHAPVSLRG